MTSQNQEHSGNDTSLAVREAAQVVSLSEHAQALELKRDLLKRTLLSGSSVDELELFLMQAKRSGLDPFARQICAVFRNTKQDNSWVKKMTIQVTVDGLRLIADRTSCYAPGKPIHFEYDSQRKLVSATAYVKKFVKGQWHEVAATAFWDEYAQTMTYDNQVKLQPMWESKPHIMLGKCLPYRAVLQTNIGPLPIGEIVNKRMEVEVRSINPDTGRQEWRKVSNWFRNGSSTEWVRLRVPNMTKGNRCLLLTQDHPVLTDSGFAPASSLTPGTKIAVASETLSDAQKQILWGSLLGDGYLSGRKSPYTCPGYAEAHSQSQHDYLLWKSLALSNFFPSLSTTVAKVKGAEHGVVKLQTKASPALYEMRQQFYPLFGKKRVPAEVMQSLDDLGVAVWFMDDGSLRPTGKGTGCSPYLRLYTCAFTSDEHLLMLEYFAQKYDVLPKVLRSERNPYLQFSVRDTARLLDALSSYIAYNPETPTGKHWIADVPVPGVVDGHTYVPLISIESFPSRGRDGQPEPEGRYDIEVEGAHNFLYNNVVVHNCAESLALRKAFPAETSGLYSREEMGTSDYIDGEMRVLEAEQDEPQAARMPAETAAPAPTTAPKAVKKLDGSDSVPSSKAQRKVENPLKRSLWNELQALGISKESIPLMVLAQSRELAMDDAATFDLLSSVEQSKVYQLLIEKAEQLKRERDNESDESDEADTEHQNPLEVELEASTKN